MNLIEKITECQTRYEVIGVVDLNHWYTLPVFKREPWLRDQMQSLHRESFDLNQRIVFTLTDDDEYDSEGDKIGTILKNLTYFLNKIDITNCFVILLTNAPNVEGVKSWMREHSTDTTEISIEIVDDSRERKTESGYQYNSSTPVKISLDQLSDKESFLLTQSKRFCIYPWIHLHAYPTGAAYPCCQSEMRYPVGDCRKNTLQEIWNSPEQKKLRRNMLSETPNPACNRCYEQEESGFFSGRRSANKHHGHHIDRVHDTQADGTYGKFEMTYWDIRFSNLCNLRCRSCGHIFSSQWYQDQTR
jgi:radical SAM protein with 4Fe4S-binding SPASM domain